MKHKNTSKRRLHKASRSAGLVVNDAAPTPVAHKLTVFTSNVSAKLIRNDTMEGKSFVVVPMVMMVEGVHAGSLGPLYYPKDELAKTPAVWNHKPVVVYHPTINGEGVSACDPEILTTHKIGVIMNTKFDKMNRLTAEAWLEEERVKAVDQRVWNAIQKKKVLELSTGLFTDNEETAGEFEGEKYVAVARNYRPDHLAVLPDQTGACSVKDGAGFIRNAAGDVEIPQAVMDRLVARFEQESGLTTNELSHESVRQLLYAALQKRFPSTPSMPCGVWIEAVYDDFLVYSDSNGYHKIGYTIDGATAVISTDAPEDVIRVTEFRTASGAFVGNTATSQTPTNNKQNTIDMNKATIIAALIANCGWSEQDRAFLETLSEDKLAKMQPKSAAPVQAPAVNNAPATLESFIASAPDSFKGVLNEGLKAHNTAKDAAIAVITANASNSFTKEQLAGFDLGTLQAMAKLATPAAPANNQQQAPAANQQAAAPVGNFAAAGGQLAPQTTAPVGNAGTVEALPLPSLSWDK